MLTIFSVPKPFKGHIAIIQRNAILSWLSVFPGGEVILFGNEEGVAEIAKEFNLRHIPEINKNEFGTPLINDVFEKAGKIAKHNILAYINADIVLMRDFPKAVEKIKFTNFLMVGRRTDLDLGEAIDFKKSDWEKELSRQVERKGKLHGPAGIDYFVFPRRFWKEIPPFALGRTVWDNWLLYQAWIKKTPLIDATPVVTIIHQNHDYSHHPGGKTGIWTGPEAQKNLKLAGGISHLFTIRDADFRLTPDGIKKAKLNFYRIFSFPFRYYDRLPDLRPLLFGGWLFMVCYRKIMKTL